MPPSGAYGDSPASLARYMTYVKGLTAERMWENGVLENYVGGTWLVDRTMLAEELRANNARNFEERWSNPDPRRPADERVIRGSGVPPRF